MRALGIDDGYFFARIVHGQPGTVANICTEGFCDENVLKESLRMFVLLGGYRATPPLFWTLFNKEKGIVARFIASRNRITAAILYQMYAWMSGQTIILEFDKPYIVDSTFLFNHKNLYVSDKKKRSIYDRALIYCEEVSKAVFSRLKFDEIVVGRDGLFKLVAYMYYSNLRVKAFLSSQYIKMAYNGLLVS